MNCRRRATVVDPAGDPLSDAALADVYRASRRPVGDHLSQDQWEHLTCDELSAADRDGALAHIESCGDCSTIHRSLLELRDGATAIEDTRPRDNAGLSYRRWTIAGGLATAAAIVFAVLVNQPARTTPGDEVTRSSETRAAIALVTPSPNSVLAGRRFEWQPVATATAYELRVTTADGAGVWSTRVTAPTIELPEGVVMRSGAYYWQVTALREDAAIASSPMVAFRVN